MPDISDMTDEELEAIASGVELGGMSDADLESIAGPGPEPEGPGMGEALARGGAQGVTLGFGDEASGFLASLLGEQEPRTVGRGIDAPLDPRSGYEVERDILRGQNVAAQEASPGAYMAGEIGGALSTAPFTGGAAGGVLKGMGARLGGRAGAAVGGAGKALSTVDPTLGGRLGRVGAGIAEGVGVGALEGAGRSEMEFGSGEMLQDVAMGAGVGGLFPAALHGGMAAGRGIKRLASEGLESQPVEDLITQGSRSAYNKFLSPEGRETAEALTAAGPEGVAAREMMDVGPRELDVASRSLSQQVATAKNASEHVIQSLGIDKKPQVFVDVFTRSPALKTPREIEAVVTREMITPLREVASDFIKRADLYERGTGARGIFLNKALTEYGFDMKKAAQEVSSPDSQARMFVALDKLKRMLGKEQGSIRGKTEQHILRESYERFRGLLADPTVWGDEAAAKQSRMNQAWTEKITADKAGPGYSRYFISDAPVGRSMVDAFEPMKAAQTKKIDAWVREAGTPAADEITEVLRTGIAADARLAKVLAEEYGQAVNPRVVGWMSEATQAAQEASKTIDSSVARGRSAREFSHLQEEVSGLRGERLPMASKLAQKVGVPTPDVRARNMSFLDIQRDLISQAAQSPNPALSQSADQIMRAAQIPGIAGAVEYFKQVQTNTELRKELENR